MKAIYDEEIEVIGRIDGTLVVQLRWRDKAWEEELPRDIGCWPIHEQKTHMAPIVIRLRLKLLEAQKEALSDPATTADDCVARIQYDDGDLERMEAAKRKRDRKAGKIIIAH